MIKDVKGFRPELQVNFFRNCEGFGKRYVSRPVTRADKCIPAKIAHTSETWRRKEVVGQIESVGPLLVCRLNVICYRIRPVIFFAIKVVIATDIHALL